MAKGNGLKAQQNSINEQIESVKIKRLETKLTLENEGLKQDTLDLFKSRITTQIKGEAIKHESIKLSGSRVQTLIEQTALGKTQDRLSFEQADRLLTQQEYQAKLTLKSINVAAMREEIRHAGVLHGDAQAKSVNFSSRQNFSGRQSANIPQFKEGGKQ